MKKVLRIIPLMLVSLFGVGQAISYSDFGNLGKGLTGGFYLRGLFYDTIGKKLYAGGHFTFAENKPVWGVAVWNGTKWDSLQGGLTKYPHVPALPTEASQFAWKIIRFKNKIYFAGAFDWVNGKNQYNLAVWNGNSWDYPLPQPLASNAQIYDMVVYNDNLYVCGDFTMIGSIPCNYVAKFDGINWQPVGDFTKFQKSYGPPAQVTSIEIYNSEIYIGGGFSDSTGTPRNIAKFDGTNWVNVGSGIRQGGINFVTSLEVFNNELYIGGRFGKTQEIPGRNLVKWDGSNYMGYGASDLSDGQVFDLTAHKTRLFVLGSFSMYGNNIAQGLLYIDSNNQCTVNGLDSVLYAQSPFFQRCAFINDSLIVGGGFSFSNGNDTVNDIAVMKNYEQYSSCLVTGLGENYLVDNSVKVYPNPTFSKLYIEYSELESNRVAFSISDNLGRVVFFEEGTHESREINVEFLQPGIYFLRLDNGLNRKTFKFIKH